MHLVMVIFAYSLIESQASDKYTFTISYWYSLRLSPFGQTTHLCTIETKHGYIYLDYQISYSNLHNRKATHLSLLVA